MQILHDRAYLYIALTIGMNNILVPFILNHVFYGKLHYFWRKKTLFFFNQNPFFLLKELNKACTFIHNQTFKYIVHTIVNMKSF